MSRSLTLLVTAGPTVEDLDPVRFISNRATGKLGFAVAEQGVRAGHRVILIHGPVAAELVRRLPHAPGLTRVPVRSCAEMHRAVLKALPRADAVVMTAAVADFTPARVAKAKLKKARAGCTIRLKPTVDILQDLGQRKRTRHRPLALIGFALETGQGRTAAARRRTRYAEARRKLAAKNLDAIVLDTPAAMGADRGIFHVLRTGSSSPQTLRASKVELARMLVRLAEVGLRPAPQK